MINKNDAPVLAHNLFAPEKHIPIRPWVLHALEHVQRVRVLQCITPLHVCVCTDHQTAEQRLLVQQRRATRTTAQLEDGA